MVKVCKNGVWILKGREIIEDSPENQGKLKNLPHQAQGGDNREACRGQTIAAGILLAHHQPDSGAESVLPKELKLKFDVMASHDITYVNIIQTAKVSGLEEFPVPYVLTNCHNSLCAVGGTINADDHAFGLSAAKRYGGVFVPPHLAVIHSYIRETQAKSGRMILGSDSHTRYGFLGTMGVGEGGGELVKQLLGQTCGAPWPRVLAVYLTGKPRQGTGPQDVALAVIGGVFKDGFAKNTVLEFLGDGIGELSADFRAGIDVMTTETACWSSVWETDETVRRYLAAHGREGDYEKLFPGDIAYYDGMIYVDLSTVKPMIALPFHPSNVYELDTFLANAGDILRKVEADGPGINLKLTDKIDAEGCVRVDQAIVAGCAGGTFENLLAVNSILEIGTDHAAGELNFAVYPGSQPILLELSKNGTLSSLISKGVAVRTAFCGPCFGAGDVPPNNGLSIRHTTRNFPNREGSKPGEGQISSVCLMDARSIAATVLNNGRLASAESLNYEDRAPYRFDPAPYSARVYNGIGKPDRAVELRYGPNITDWPPMDSLGENLLVKIASYITDEVTTTDELIPSGETSSFRSNPVGLAEHTLSRKDPAYVGKAKAVSRASRVLPSDSAKAAEFLPELPGVLEAVSEVFPSQEPVILASAIFARKPGDGSAREQAASCQRVLGGAANFANEYATKRYRSNLINWGILPFTLDGEPPFGNGDYVFIPGIAYALRNSLASIPAFAISGSGAAPVAFTLKIPELSPIEKEIVLDGCLINYNRRLLNRS
jgi:aconitate hydratase